MSDSESKPKGGVPSWQMKPEASDPKPATEEKPASESSSPEPKPRSSVLEDARKFLEEDEVKDASTDKKVAFLEGKGLTSEEIHQLLGITRNLEATSLESQASPKTQAPPPQPTATTTPPPQPQASPQPPPQTPAQPYRDTPPIITYPEFLTTPTSPPPLITASRLLKTLYLFSGLSALLYGTSTHLVAPMSSALSSARHELLAAAQMHLDTLVSKLKPLVSELPPQPVLAQGERYEDRDEEDSDGGDPTEMFHRDIGVQTSPPPSRPSSPSQEEKISVAESQAKKASNIGAILSEVDLTIASELREAGNLQDGIEDLKKYLDSLMYSPPTFSYGAGSAFGAKRDEDDEIGRVKREIRAVKGVLLTARSFPGVGAGVR
ncbi:hypothetical protein VE02_01927 [Pseudogymnoascus sp. 03VT05]|nr:hypothetical protein VE02_01927 [Pseudogymnoascus sp. 03VT05]